MEAASLAGMLKGPEIYNPLYEKGKYATDRRNTVLQNMVNAGYLEQSQADSFMKVDLQAQLQDNYQSKSSQYKYPSYYNAVISEAERKYGLTLQEIMNNGYKIYTGMDQNMQSGLQKPMRIQASSHKQQMEPMPSQHRWQLIQKQELLMLSWVMLIQKVLIVLLIITMRQCLNVLPVRSSNH